MLIFSQRLKEQRKLHKKTQDDMARLLNTSRANYGYYEAGKQLPPVDKLALLAEHFQVSMEYLIGNQDKQVVDILETIQYVMNHLKDNNVVLNGQELNDQAYSLIACSLENALHTTKTIERNVLK